MNNENYNKLIEKIYSDFKQSLEDIYNNYPEVYDKIINECDGIISNLKIRNSSPSIDNYQEIAVKKSILSPHREKGKNFFTITSKESFNNLNNKH